MMEAGIRVDGTRLEDLIARVKEGERRDWMLDCEIAVVLQYLPDSSAQYTNVRAHPTSSITMLYDTPMREGSSTFIPMFTSSLDAVEKLRASRSPDWRIDALHVQSDEYTVRATSDAGASVQATARTEARARLAVVLEALAQKQANGGLSSLPSAETV
jgi:hypothetical protein